MTKNILNQILEETNGELLYSEQVIAILTKCLGYSVDQADTIRKRFAKKAPRFENFKEEFSKKAKNEEVGSFIFNLFCQKMNSVESKTYYETISKMQNSSIDIILDMAGGELKYESQMFLLLTEVVRLEIKTAEEAIEVFKEQEALSLMEVKYIIHSKCKFDVAKRIFDLLEKHAPNVIAVNTSLIPFIEIK